MSRRSRTLTSNPFLSPLELDETVRRHTGLCPVNSLRGSDGALLMDTGELSYLNLLFNCNPLGSSIPLDQLA
ncbi:hypothetical protein TNCV_2950111 [Trichonephila clavipes]|nr:hypothetical protein TNCV_2950111 [Trichonephila clavipes]